MPEWLLKKDDYIPRKDKDTFIDRSVLSFLQVLSKFRIKTEYKSSKFYINALIKLISTIILLIFISLSKSFTFILVTNVGIIVLINFLSISEIKYVLKVSAVVVIFTFIIFLPAIIMGYGSNSLITILRVFASVVSVNTLACTTQWNDLISAFKFFRVPDMFIFVLDITMKYIIILGEFSLDMIYSLKLRSVGRSNSKTTALSGIVGTMFIKSKEMAEEMCSAMECRGFTGEYNSYSKLNLKIQDYIFIIVDIVFILAYFYFDRL